MNSLSKEDARKMLIVRFLAAEPIEWDIIKDNATAFVYAADDLRYEGFGGRDFWRFVCHDLRINHEDIGQFLNAKRDATSVPESVNYDHPAMVEYIKKRQNGRT